MRIVNSRRHIESTTTYADTRRDQGNRLYCHYDSQVSYLCVEYE
jgi:hypothetical protein